MKELLYNFVFFPLPIIWFMLFLILFKSKNIHLYFKAVFIVLFLISLPIFSECLKYPLNSGASKFIKGDDVSAVIVLTGGAYKDINDNWYPSSTTIKRTALANNISKELKKPLIILGGNNKSNYHAESLLVSKFIENDNLVLDIESETTYQSVKNLKNILLKNNLNTKGNFLIITSKIHNLRTALTFNSFNYKVKIYNYPVFSNISLLSFVPSSKSFIYFNNVLYEYCGIIKYLFLGYIKF